MDLKGLFSQAKNNLQEKLIGQSVRAVLTKYPDAKPDLVQHFMASKVLTDTVGPVNSLRVGLFKEVLDGVGALIGTGPTKGRKAGFSVDDLGADWAGAISMSPDEAYRKGLFNHTELAKNITGLGQGKPVEVFKKIIK
jgi:hypothetical protein